LRRGDGWWARARPWWQTIRREIKVLLAEERGFSTIEMIITLILVAIIGIVFTPVLTGAVKGYMWEQAVVGTNAQAQLAMERMAREMRGMAPTDITSFSATQITFVMNGIPVTYGRNGENQLLRNSDVLATGVSSLSFGYFGDDWTSAVAQAGEIWRIRIAMTLIGDGLSETVQTSVFLHSGSTNR
jgi:type II secretory pathway pseudopilin PulG